MFDLKGETDFKQMQDLKANEMAMKMSKDVTSVSTQKQMFDRLNKEEEVAEELEAG